jgi:hypothetical protein
MKRWQTVMLALLALLGGCRTVDGRPLLSPCTALQATKIDTVYFVGITPPKISTILYECP